MLKLSQSRVNAWRQCRQRFAYKFTDKLVPKRKSRPLVFGSIVHKMLEANITGAADPFEVLDAEIAAQERAFIEDEEEYGRIQEDITYIMNEYFDYWATFDGRYYPVNKKKAEIKFEVELNKDFIVQGKVDAFMKARRMRWLVEHKTHKTFPNDDHRWRNLQSCLYVRLNDIMGWPSVEGTLWDYIRSKPPSRPQLLKSGAVSTREIDTLPSVIHDFIKQQRLSLAQYKHLIVEQGAKLDMWFKRIFTPIKHEVVDAIVDDFTATGYDILRNEGKQTVRTIGRHCEWCEYEPLCRAALQGSDVEFVKEHQFDVAERDYDEVEEVKE